MTSAGSALASQIFQEEEADLRPHFEEMKRKGYQDVTFVVLHTNAREKKARHYNQGFVFTHPDRTTYCSISRTSIRYGRAEWSDKEFHHYMTDQPFERLNSETLGFSPWLDKKGRRFVGEPADLALVLQEGHFQVPPSANAVRIEKIFEPIESALRDYRRIRSKSIFSTIKSRFHFGSIQALQRGK
jgi:hypothetical protein